MIFVMIAIKEYVLVHVVQGVNHVRIFFVNIVLNIVQFAKV